MTEDIQRALGRIEGQLHGINQSLETHGKQLVAIDGRLRSAENKAAYAGGKAGVLTGVGVALLVESVRAWAGTKFGG